MGAYLNNPSLPLSDGAHWNANTTINGMLNNGYYSFIPKDDTYFTLNCNWHGSHFAPIELYTMGVLSKEGLDSSATYILIDPNISTTLNDYDLCDTLISPERFVKVTSDTLVKIYGEREPNLYNSQKHFKTVAILITERQPTVEEICVWNKILRHYSEPFDENDLDGFNWDEVPSFANHTYGRLSNDFLIDLPSSIEDGIINSKIYFYPNPVNTIGIFTYPINRTVQIEIYDISGMLLKLLNDSDHNGETEVNFHNLNSGFYLYRLMDSNGIIYSGKIIRE